MRRDDNEKSESTDRIVKPDFDGWDINLAPESWLKYPLFAKGGPLAIVFVAIWKLAEIAHAALNATGLSEGSRIFTTIAICTLIVCLATATVWLMRPRTTNYAKTEEKNSKRTTEPGDQASGP